MKKIKDLLFNSLGGYSKWIVVAVLLVGGFWLVNKKINVNNQQAACVGTWVSTGTFGGYCVPKPATKGPATKGR